jgi:hypothetical protein
VRSSQVCKPFQPCKPLLRSKSYGSYQFTASLHVSLFLHTQQNSLDWNNAPSLEAVYPVPDDDPLEGRIMEEEFLDSSVQGTYLLLYECILQA